MTVDLEELRKAAEKATKGDWFADSVKSDGCYGSGDDVHEGYNAYAVYTDAIDHYGHAASICDTHNANVCEVHEEWDEDGHSAWDEVGRCNMEFIALANPQTILAMIGEIERLNAASELTDSLLSNYRPGMDREKLVTIILNARAALATEPVKEG